MRTRVRVRFSPTRAFGRDHSYAVIRRDLGPAGAAFRIGGAESVITTRALRVMVRHAPFRIAFATASGASLDEDDPELGTALALGALGELRDRLVGGVKADVLLARLGENLLRRVAPAHVVEFVHVEAAVGPFALRFTLEAHRSKLRRVEGASS